MKRFATILFYDWLQLKRSSSFWLITSLLFGIGIYALYYGHQEVKEQQQKIAVLKHAIDSTNQDLYDTLQVKDTSAVEAAYHSGMLYANYPKPLSALSFGERDVNKFALNLATFTFFYDKYSTGYSNKTLSSEIVNPMKLLAGSLDISFVLVFLMPLYFILVSYNIFSSEKENGTYELLRIQGESISRIIILRLVFRGILINIFGFLFIAVGGIIAQADIASLFSFLFVFASYTVCWAGIIFLLCRNGHSGRNAIALITAWLMICFVLPALYNAILNTQHPVDAKVALSASIQKAESESYPMPGKIKMDSFLTLFPKYRTASMDTLGSWHDGRWYSCTYGIMDHYTESFEQAHQQIWSQRIQVANRWIYGSPALMAQYAFNQLAASNTEQMQAFDTLAYQGFRKRRGFFNDAIFIDKNVFRKADFAKIPVAYLYEPAISVSSYLLPVFLMLIIGMILFFAALKSKQRWD